MNFFCPRFSAYSRPTLLGGFRFRAFFVAMTLWLLASPFLSAGVFTGAAPYVSGTNTYYDWSYDYRDNYVDIDDLELLGRIYVPKNYDPNKSYPLVVYFHGNGQGSPTDTSKALRGTDSNLRNAAAREDFFLYVPQVKTTSLGWGYPMGVNQERVMLQIGNLQSAYSIDREKLYITGFSMGGHAVWSQLSTHSGAIAAAIPIAPNAGGVPDINAQKLLNKPIWAFHNRADTLLGNTQPRSRVNQIRTATGKSPWVFSNTGDNFYEEDGLRYSENASEGGHSTSWAYRKQELYDWMLDQKNTTGWLQDGETLLFDLGGNQMPSAEAVDSYGGGLYQTGSRFDTEGRVWNSTFQDLGVTTGVAVAFAKTTEGRSTFVNLSVKTTFGGKYTSGTGQDLFDPLIGEDGWVTKSGAAAEILLEGLTPGQLYDLEIFASTSNTANSYKFTQYQIGGELRWLQVGGNANTMVGFDGIAADSLGRILLGIQGTMGSTFGLIGTLSVKPSAVPEPATALLVGIGASWLAFAVRRRKI